MTFAVGNLAPKEYVLGPSFFLPSVPLQTMSVWGAGVLTRSELL